MSLVSWDFREEAVSPLSLEWVGCREHRRVASRVGGECVGEGGVSVGI